MSQSFNIGEKIDVSNISVQFVDGLLTINLPIKSVTEINNRKIEIK
jgi:HSP20 family molecular chaperone IbpA